MSKETILILDKENHTRWILKALLEAERYIVIAVHTVERALQNFAEFEVSGLITEYWIDQVSTLDTIRQLKARSPEAYVMMLTTDDVDEKEYEELIGAGVDDYFVKPAPTWKILIHLKEGLKQRSILLHKKRMEYELVRLKEKGEDVGAAVTGNGDEDPAQEIEENIPVPENSVSGNATG